MFEVLSSPWEVQNVLRRLVYVKTGPVNFNGFACLPGVFLGMRHVSNNSQDLVRTSTMQTGKLVVDLWFLRATRYNSNASRVDSYSASTRAIALVIVGSNKIHL